MGRYTGAVCRICRREGDKPGIFCRAVSVGVCSLPVPSLTIQTVESVKTVETDKAIWIANDFDDYCPSMISEESPMFSSANCPSKIAFSPIREFLTSALLMLALSLIMASLTME